MFVALQISHSVKARVFKSPLDVPAAYGSGIDLIRAPDIDLVTVANGPVSRLDVNERPRNRRL